MAENPRNNPTGFGDFKIPNEVRKFAEQSVDQARKAFETFISASLKTAGTLEGQASAAQEGAKDVRHKAIAFAERNVATSFDFARRLLQAHDADEVMRLQAEFIQSQMVALTEQAQELGQTVTKAAMDATKRGP